MVEIKKQKTFAELPEEIRELLSDETLVERIEAIAARQGLPPMEQGFLVRICANLMKGIIAPGVFVNTIVDELDISREKAATLAQEINRDIFSPVKDALRAVHTKPGGIVRLDPSLVTCLPAQMSKEAAIGNKAPGNAPVGNILEQKLAGTFRIKEGVVMAPPPPPPAPPAPRIVVPPPPHSVMPPAPPAPGKQVFSIPTVGGQSGPPKSDPYRDHA